MIYLVAFHSNPLAINAGFHDAVFQFLLPMYFFLSGVFFKLYDGFGDFTRRKVNNIIIPAMFFIVIGLLFTLLRSRLTGHVELGSSIALFPFDPAGFNVPIWFLFVLFEVNIIYYLLQKLFRRWVTNVLMILLSVVGYVVAIKGYHLVAYHDIALIATPFFALGAETRRAGLLTSGPTAWVRLFYAAAVLVLLFFFASEINMYDRTYPDYLRLYILPCLAIMALLFLCQYIKHPVPLVSYLGRYSIIVLGTQDIVIKLFKGTLIRFLHDPAAIDSQLVWLITLLVTLALEFPIIMLLKKYAPRLTAQEAFFKPGWKV